MAGADAARTVTAGIDAGGTKVAGALVADDGRVVARVRRSSLVDGRRDPGLRVTRAVARLLVARAERLGLAIDGFGAGFPEYVAPDGRLTSHEVLGWRRQPAAVLAPFGPVTVGSDVRCAALAEARLGAGRGHRSAAYLTLGTGIAWALAIDGQVWAGERGEAIALGELPVADRPGERLEPYASGEGIRRRYEAVTGIAVTGAREVVGLAAAGDPVALAVVTTAGAAAGAAAATLVALLDPAVVIVGGGLAGAGGAWRRAFTDAYRDGTRRRRAAPPVRRAALGRDAGTVGAALLHRDRIDRERRP